MSKYYFPLNEVGSLNGPDLVTNGGFDGGVSTGWTMSNITPDATGFDLKITNSTTAFGLAYQAISTTSGRTYVVSFKCKLGTATAAYLKIGTTSSGAELGQSETITSTTYQTVSLVFIATGATSYISLWNGSSTSGHYSYYDNVVVRELNYYSLETQHGIKGVNVNTYPIQDHRGSGDRWYEFDGNDQISAGNVSASNIYSGVIIFYTATAISQASTGRALMTLSGINDGALYLGGITGSFSNEIIAFSSGSGHYSYYASATESIPIGWNTIAYVWDGSKYQIYLNGTSLTMSTYGTPALRPADDVFIGSWGSAEYFTGDVPMVRLFNAALSESDVAYYSEPSNPIKAVDVSACVLNLNAEGLYKNIWEDKLNGIVATVSGATAVIPPTSNLGATWFNGVDSKTTYTGMDGLTGDITISGWILAQSNATSFKRILFNTKVDLLYNTTNTLAFSRDQSAYAVSANSALTLNAAHFICITSSNAGVTNIYIDGVLSGSANQSAGTPVSNTTYYIGDNNADTGKYIGWIKDLKIEKRIWSLDEIQREYAKYSN